MTATQSTIDKAPATRADVGGIAFLSQLGADFIVRLALRLPPFAMADDGQGSAGVGKHYRRGATGVRAFFGKMHVLPADGEAGNGANRALDQDRRDAQSDIDLRKGARGIRDLDDLSQVSGDAVHLPIARNELLQCHRPDSPPP